MINAKLNVEMSVRPFYTRFLSYARLINEGHREETDRQETVGRQTENQKRGRWETDRRQTVDRQADRAQTGDRQATDRRQTLGR